MDRYWWCSDDCPENKNLITNFAKSERPIYQKAIDKYGWNGLYISKDAYWRDGTKDNKAYSLRWSGKERIDLSRFWEIFNEFYEEMSLIKALDKIYGNN